MKNFGSKIYLQKVEQLFFQDPHHFEDKYPSSTSKSTPEKFKVVACRVSHNTCVQIYDYKLKKPRIIFGSKIIHAWSG